MIVPCFGAPRTLPALLECLAQQTLDPRHYEVLLVDTGADGGLRLLEEALEGWEGPSVRVLRGPLSGGPAGRRNHGASEAAGRMLAFTDADCEPEPAWLETGLAAGAALVQGSTLPPRGAEVSAFAHFHVIEHATGLFETCNMFYDRELFTRLGGFPTHYFLGLLEPFGEDTELGWRARRAGARFRFEPEAVVRHAVTARPAGAHLRYLWRGRSFPRLVRRAPELRTEFLYRRLFLSRRSALFKAALAGLALSRRHPMAALLALPYLRELAPEKPRDAAMHLVCDAVTCAALAYGSVRHGEPVL